MTAGIMPCDRPVAGVPGAAIRLGRMLELWGRRAARPVDRDEARRAHEHARLLEERVREADRAVLLRVF